MTSRLDSGPAKERNRRRNESGHSGNCVSSAGAGNQHGGSGARVPRLVGREDRRQNRHSHAAYRGARTSAPRTWRWRPRRSCSPRVAARRRISITSCCARRVPDYFLPTTACLIQERLGIPRTAGALDFNLGCSGYVAGLGLAQGLIETGQAGRVLLLTAETYSKFLHPEDRSVRTIFGDAAAATLVAGGGGRGAVSRPVHVWDRRRRRQEPDRARRGNAAPPCREKPPIAGRIRRPEPRRSHDYLFMDGAEIFNFTLVNVPTCVQRLLDRRRQEPGRNRPLRVSSGQPVHAGASAQANAHSRRAVLPRDGDIAATPFPPPFRSRSGMPCAKAGWRRAARPCWWASESGTPGPRRWCAGHECGTGPAFIITIDTEGDNLWSQPRQITTRNSAVPAPFSGVMRALRLQADVSH